MEEKRWVFHQDVQAEETDGVVRRILAYTDDVMAVENTFRKGGVGKLHHHPHTQITYVVSGVFEFEIDGERHIVRAGDAMLKTNEVVHGCVCLEDGILLDIFSPKREDFLEKVQNGQK